MESIAQFFNVNQREFGDVTGFLNINLATGSKYTCRNY